MIHSLTNLKLIIMKTLLKNSLFALCIFFALAITFSSCTKEDLDDTIQTELVTENNETDIENRAPNILVDDITPLYCCGGWFNKRNVRVTLDPLTYSYFCSGGLNLVYKFYNTNYPCNAPIVRFSNQASPTFCLPGNRDYTLFICNNTSGCDLDCNGGSGLTIEPGVPTSSPMYEFTLNTCSAPIHR